MDNVYINPFDPTSKIDYLVHVKDVHIELVFKKFFELSYFIADCKNIERKTLETNSAITLYLTYDNDIGKYVITWNNYFLLNTKHYCTVSTMDILNYEFDCESYPTKQINKPEKNTEEHSVDISLESGALAEEVMLCLVYSGYTIKYDSVKNIIKVVKGN